MCVLTKVQSVLHSVYAYVQESLCALYSLLKWDSNHLFLFINLHKTIYSRKLAIWVMFIAAEEFTWERKDLLS